MKTLLCETLLSATDPASAAKTILVLKKPDVLKQENFICLKKILETEGPLLVRFVAARALAQANPKEAPRAVVEVLLTVMENAKPIVEAYKPLAVRSYDAVDEACISLCLAGQGYENEIISHLIPILDSYTGFNSSMIAHTLLYLAFNGKQEGIKAGFTNLSKTQQGVLLKILDSRRCWRFAGNMSQSLRHFELPETWKTLRDYCGA